MSLMHAFSETINPFAPKVLCRISSCWGCPYHKSLLLVADACLGYNPWLAERCGLHVLNMASSSSSW